MKVEGSSISFDNLLSSSSNINRVGEAEKIILDDYTHVFVSTNSTGDFQAMTTVDDLKTQHTKSKETAKGILTLSQ